MCMRKKTYTEEQLILAVKTSKSYAQVIKKLGLKQAGGTQKNIKHEINNLQCDLSHFHFQKWNKDKKLKEYADYKHYKYARHHLILERGEKCENCNNSEWCGKKITLEIHHIDCDRKNNNPNNLQVLCPNCHSITHGYKRRKGDYVLKSSSGKVIK